MLNLFDGVLIGPDQNSTAIVLQLLSAGNSPVSRGETVAAIRETAAATIPGAAVAGEAVQIQDMFNLVERDGNILYIASLIVLSIMLLVIFRNLRWVLASVGIVIASVACTRAMLVICGRSVEHGEFNAQFAGDCDFDRHHNTCHRALPRTASRILISIQRPLRTLRELWHPVMWTVITIAVGFAALLVSDIVPVRSFAIMMTLGTLMVLVVSIAVLPATFASGQGADSGTSPYGRAARPTPRQDGSRN